MALAGVCAGGLFARDCDGAVWLGGSEQYSRIRSLPDPDPADSIGAVEWISVEIIYDTSAADVIRGSGNAETVIPTPAAGHFPASGGDDTFTIFGSLRDTRIDGGDGFDTLSFGSVGFGAPLFQESLLDLDQPSRSSGSFEGSRITGIESFSFAPASDTTDLEFRGTVAGERVVFGNSFLAGAAARLALGGGDDEGVGGVGDDTILAGRGRDILEGRGGDDSLDGGKGADRFRFQQGFGEDTIAGFRPDSDRLDFSPHFAVIGIGDLSMSRRGNDTLIEVGLGDSILLLDVAPREIDRGDLRLRLRAGAGSGCAARGGRAVSRCRPTE